MVMAMVLSFSAWAETDSRVEREIRQRKSDLSIAEVFDETAFSYTRLVYEVRFMKYGISLFERSVYRSPGKRDYGRLADLVIEDAENALAKEAIYRDGKLVYALLQMPSIGKLNRFIAFQKEGEDLSIVYMEGETTLENLKNTFVRK